MTSPLNLADLLPDDVSVGQLGHEKWHDYLHQSVKAMKNLLVTLDDAAVKKTGDQTIAGIKTFSSPINGATPTADSHLTTKLYVDQGLAGKTNTGHTHTIANITSLQTTLDAKQPLITAGTTSQYYRGDKTWATLDKTAANIKEFGDLIATYNTAVGFTTLDFSIPGNYSIGPNVTDMPTTGQTWNVTILSSNSNGLLAHAIRSGATSPYLRVKATSGWAGWQGISGGYSSMTQAEGNTGTATSQRVLSALDLKAIIQTHAQALVDTGTVKTTGNQSVDGIKSFTSAPKLKTTSTAGYAWVATGSDGSGDWSAIVNAPGGTVPWANITGKPSTFTPEAHVHAISDITSLSTTLSGKVDTSRTITAGTGLTGGGDLSANRTLTVAYGTAAGTAAQGNDSRLSDTRTPSALSVVTSTIADANITLPKLATTAKPYDFSFVQSLDTRAVGYGEMVYGVLINKSITLTSIHYRLGTADASGTTTAQIYTATTADGAKTAVAGTSGTAAVNPTPITGSVSIAAGTYLFVYTSAIGTTPGKGLIAEIQAYLT